MIKLQLIFSKMDELERLRQKKAEELMRARQNKQQQERELDHIESQIKSFLTKKALERYGNIKVAYPEKSQQLLMVLAQIIQTRNITKITDQQLKSILKQMQDKRDFKVKFR